MQIINGLTGLPFGPGQGPFGPTGLVGQGQPGQPGSPGTNNGASAQTIRRVIKKVGQEMSCTFCEDLRFCFSHKIKKDDGSFKIFNRTASEEGKET